jgi:putative membrane protein
LTIRRGLGKKPWRNGGVLKKKSFINLKSKAMWYYQYYWGMNWIWWVLWIMLLIWIFAVPYDIPGQRRRRQDALDILKKRYASGQIDLKEYEERKAVIERNELK